MLFNNMCLILQAVDLRWGMSDAGTSRNPFATDLCLRHIAATQAASIGPNVAVSDLEFPYLRLEILVISTTTTPYNP